MGHANLENISKAFNRRLYAKGHLSIAEATAVMVEAGEEVHASEGGYKDPDMISMALEEIVGILREPHHPLHTAVIEPAAVLNRQKSEILSKWDDEGLDSEDEYEILDSIPWRFARGWRRLYPNIPVVRHVTN